MPENNVNNATELTEQEKVVSLFQFIQELNKLKQKAILNLKDYPWYFALSNLHEDPDNIQVYYRDRVENEDVDITSTLLTVRKPDFQKCPSPDKSFEKWLNSEWDIYINEATVKDVLEEEKPAANAIHSLFDNADDGEVVIKESPERFTDDEKRVSAFTVWKGKRAVWVEKQRIIEKTRNLFSDLYRLYFELQKESETEEIIAANGILHDSEDPRIMHPVLTHRVKLSFDPDKNIVSIEDTNVPSELYSVVFQMMENVNLSAINQMSADLQKNDYHPLDRNDTPSFLKVLVHQLSSNSKFSESGVPENWKQNSRLLLTLDPCYIVRKRLDGTLKAIEQIIENIQETKEVPAPIRDIVNGGKIDIPEDVGEEAVEEQLAAVGGESMVILLSKEANKEQLEIAKRIEYYNAVLVQGPPGTGKTHTIANLMGHFLALGKYVLVTSHTTKALSVLKEKVAPGLQHLCVSILDDSNLDMERSVDGITDYMSKTTSHELKKEMDMLATERREIIAKLAKVRRSIFTILNQEYDNIVLNGVGISPSQAAEFVRNHAENLSYIPGYVKLRAPLPLSFEQITDLYRSNEGISLNDETELKCGIPNPETVLSPSNFTQTWETLQSALRQRHNISAEKGWNIDNYPENTQIKVSGSFGKFVMPYPTEENIVKLKNYVSSLGKIEQWMKCAAVDGKNGGSYRQRWTMLIEKIQETCSFAESIITERFGKNITFAVDDIAPLQEAYKRMKATFAEKGKLSKLTLAFHKDYETALKQVNIDGKPVSNAADCDIILNTITLQNLRKQCGLYWNDLLTPNGVPKFEELDINTPENIAANWIPLINRYLDWYKTDYQPLLDLLSLNQIPAKLVLEINALDSDLTATGKILNAVENTIPFICDICSTVLKERDMTALIDFTKRTLTSGKRGGSKVCQNLYNAANVGNCSAYAEVYAALEEMFTKYDLQTKRGELLAKLEPYAPTWAEAIRTRTGIHGQATAPADIEDAWKWKQLSGIIEEITAQPFAEMQAESLRLSQEYRATTAKYAEKNGWYHLLKRTEADIDMKQALQGWKQTVKRIGKGTGRQAPMLKAKARELVTKCQIAVPGWIMPINKALESLNPKTNRFDIIIIDEASQSDVSSLAILYMGKKLIIVGDDKQVSPMAVGVEIDKISSLEQMYIKDKIPNSHLYNAKTSIYDIAATTFQPLMLREHFRCVPEIIGFSNMLSYDYKIKPLRDASTSVLLPAVVNYRVADGKRDGRNKTNRNEAEMIVALMQACIEQPEYASKSFGVISLLGDEQVKVIQQLIDKNIDPKEIVRRNILCGNSANFQGDERNVIFLSVVDSGDGTGPIHMQGFGVDDAFRKRYNVAASRARDQLWVVHSLDSANDLRPGDLRKMLIDYSINPQASELRNVEIEEHAESPFEAKVAMTLSDRGYHLVQQWKVGAYRLDIVAVCGKKMVAIECDGEQWHSGESKIREDMERQTILERLGWRFIRIRGSEYYRDATKTMDRVFKELSEYGIEPEDAVIMNDQGRETELLKRVKNRAAIIRYGEYGEPAENVEDTIVGALGAESQPKDNEPPAISVSPKCVSAISSTKSEIGIKVGESSIYSSNKGGEQILTQISVGESATVSVNTPVKIPVASANKGSGTKQDSLPQKPSETRKAETSHKLNDGQQTLSGMEEILPEESDVIALLKKHKVKYIDKRYNNGALWIVGGRELAPIVAECKKLGVNFVYTEKGGRSTQHKPSWWAK